MRDSVGSCLGEIEHSNLNGTAKRFSKILGLRHIGRIELGKHGAIVGRNHRNAIVGQEVEHRHIACIIALTGFERSAESKNNGRSILLYGRGSVYVDTKSIRAGNVVDICGLFGSKCRHAHACCKHRDNKMFHIHDSVGLSSEAPLTPAPNNAKSYMIGSSGRNSRNRSVSSTTARRSF